MKNATTANAMNPTVKNAYVTATLPVGGPPKAVTWPPAKSLTVKKIPSTTASANALEKATRIPSATKRRVKASTMGVAMFSTSRRPESAKATYPFQEDTSWMTATAARLKTNHAPKPSQKSDLFSLGLA